VQSPHLTRKPAPTPGKKKGGGKQNIKHTRKFRPIKCFKKTRNNKKKNNNNKNQTRRKKKIIIKKNTRKKTHSKS